MVCFKRLQKSLGYFLLAWGLIPNLISTSYAFELTQKELTILGKKIYHNECASNPKNLIHWNQNESFVSLGIGHFIWFSDQTSRMDQRYEEQFPQFARFVEQKGLLPNSLSWILHDSPWKTQKAFQEAKSRHSEAGQYAQLQNWLESSQRLQAEFIWQRFLERRAIWEAYVKAQEPQAEKLLLIFEKLLAQPQSRFAVLDYTHFKGWGDQPTEVYHGVGWGLLQVLTRMLSHMDNPSNTVSEQSHSKEPLWLENEGLRLFKIAAKQTLDQRIRLSPPEKKEFRWQTGWNYRIDSY